MSHCPRCGGKPVRIIRTIGDAGQIRIVACDLDHIFTDRSQPIHGAVTPWSRAMDAVALALLFGVIVALWIATPA